MLDVYTGITKNMMKKAPNIPVIPNTAKKSVTIELSAKAPSPIAFRKEEIAASSSKTTTEPIRETNISMTGSFVIARNQS